MYDLLNDEIKYFFNNSVPICEHPKMLKDGRLVPCGKCVLCASKDKREWITRCQLELATSRVGQFLTLTFDEEHIDNTGYSVVQKFLKRYRKYLRSHDHFNPIKYFGCYENGEKTGRPHYHIAIFGEMLLGENTIDIIQKIWQQGFVYVEPLSDQNIIYLCGYVQKKKDIDNVKPFNVCVSNREFNKINKYSVNTQSRLAYYKDYTLTLDDLRRRTFFFMSKGLGFSYLKKNLHQIMKNGCINIHGYKKPIPRAFKKYIEDNFGQKMQFFNQDYIEFLNSYNIDPFSLDLDEMQKVNEEYVFQKMKKNYNLANLKNKIGGKI